MTTVHAPAHPFTPAGPGHALGYGSVMDQLPVMIAVWDEECRNVFANAAYRSWFGLGPDEGTGLPLRTVLGPELWKLNSRHVEEVLEGRGQVFERAIPDEHGMLRSYQIEYQPHVVDGVQRGFLTVVTDISELAALRDRRELSLEFHDGLLQRLFAVGLQVAVASKPHRDPVSRLTSAMTGIDEAIDELRHSIQSLRGAHRP